MGTESRARWRGARGRAPRWTWRATAPLVCLLLALATATGAGARAPSWLDSPPRAFNTAGAAIPAAPPSHTPAGDRCRARERPAAAPEEAQVAAAGWKLESYWPTQRAGDLAIVLATSDYDGMCRDFGYSGFAFVGGRFAGTIVPQPMASRFDGALFEAPTFGADRRLTASFIRYAPTDPLCCPSRGQTRVTYRIDAPAAGPVLVPDQIAQVPPTATPTPPPSATPPPAATPRPTVPTQLPRTGTPSLAPLIPLALGLVAAGVLLRRRAVAQRR